MRLLKCHIIAFGKLENFDYDFCEGLNTVFASNGYGKTTLTMFLKAMFYGMAKKGNLKPYLAARSKYMPWSSGVYGGWLQFEVGGKRYQVSRTFASTPEGDTFELVDLDSGLRSEDYSKNLGQDIFGVGCETFEISAFLSQEGWTAGTLNDEARASLTGANKFEYDLASCSAADKILSGAITRTKADCPKQTDIENLRRAKQHIENLLASQQQDCLSMQKELEQIEQNQQQSQQREAQLKEGFKAQLASQEKLSYLKSNRQKLQAELDNLSAQRAQLLAEGDKLSATPKKKGKSLVYCLTLLLLLVAGAGMLVGYFFGATKILLYVGLAAFGVMLIEMAFVIADLLRDKKRFNRIKEGLVAAKLNLAGLDQSIASLSGQIQELDRQTAALADEHSDVDYEQELENLRGQDMQKSVLKLKVENLQSSMQEGQERLAMVESELESAQEKRAADLERLVLLQKTKEFLAKAKQNVSQRYLQPMQDAFDKLYLAFGAQERLLMDINLDINQVTDVGLKEKEYLSQGLQDLLSLCKRFALLDKIFSKEKPFIILDDPFVNLDDSKLQAAEKIVKEYAKTYQIIYLCSHTRCKF